MTKLKLLAILDSPTLQTGFARVGANLLSRFADDYEIDIWGIGYNGWPHSLPYRIFPTTGYVAGNHWQNSLPTLLRSIPMLKPDQVFIVNDPWLFSAEFMLKLKDACIKANDKCKITFYCPVDSWLNPADVSGLKHVDNLVAYTNYGEAKLLDAGAQVTDVIPHGVDPEIYRPLVKREEIRARVFGGWLRPEDTLITYVGAHSRRKAWWSVMDVFSKLLREISPSGTLSPKLLMHMDPVDQEEGTNAFAVAHQLGLTQDKVLFPQDWFGKAGMPLVTEAGLNEIYNATDVFLTCSLGEGWGLPIVEALAAGVPHVFVPNHSACAEIASELNLRGDERIRALQLSDNAIVMAGDNSRLRNPICTQSACSQILESLTAAPDERFGLTMTSQEWLSWDIIAKKFLDIMQK